ncbi:solute carrier family 25 member 40-like protein [Globomyces pollinis-pini]|nr:solute carrier family 25 member 40-like protein [Globomyces pollinis-pini]
MHYDKNQIIPASVGAALTAITMTPFDVIKSRMQFQYAYTKQPGTLSGMVSIVKKEGLPSLWRGLTPTLVLSIPATVLYYTGYENLRDVLKTELVSPTYAALFSGAIARSIAVVFISPMEMIRTRVQVGKAPLRMILKDVKYMMREQGISSLWRGLTPTLLRDAPFSAFYWVSFETMKEKMFLSYPNRSYQMDLGISFISGSVSGMLAAFLTHPFDVVKTINQASKGESVGVVEIFKHIYGARGLSGLYAGLIPRIAKVAPGCGIMISTYEVGKRYLQDD